MPLKQPNVPSHTNASPPIRRRGSVMTIVVVLTVLAALIIGSVFWMSGGDGNSVNLRSRDIHAVDRGTFDIVIPTSGELQAVRQLEVRNPLESRAVITWIVDEGVTVREGDVLIRFADDQLREVIRDTELQVSTAGNAVTAAENALEIQRSQNESELSRAILAVEMAELALEQWQKGEVVSRRQALRLALDRAERNLDRLKDKYERALELESRGFISRDELRQDEINLVEAEANLERAELDIEVYENYQYRREHAQRKADVDQAVDELDRVKKRHEANMLSKEDDLATKISQFNIRQERLGELRSQLDKTIVYAPRAGLVVYAASLESNNRGRERELPQIGTELRQNDLVIILPDISQMVASVKVHESLSGRIRAGQRANVTSDSVPDAVLPGRVLGVSVLAETGGWRDPNRREYTVRILLDNAAEHDLKPSMRCSAEIFVDRVENALHIPIQGVFRNGPMSYVFVLEGNQYVQREVTTGRMSELEIEVLSGLDASERILLREPASDERVVRLPPPSDPATSTPADPFDMSSAGETTPPDAAARPGGGQGQMPGTGGAAGQGGRMPNAMQRGGQQGGQQGGATPQRPRQPAGSNTESTGDAGA